ncbi:MAG: sensor histidine kinase [Cytophagales bacterium]|nr:sensor histidine kinase [Cytophagales bacterium]MDW8384985.1 sensor histidine kinase [Flammeovirgaceae bacterium]
MDLKRLTIFHQLTLSYLFVGGFMIFSVSLLFYYTMRQAIIERIFAQLSSINRLQKVHVEDLLLQEKSISDIKNILLIRTGMGETGESYLVDDKDTMRSESRFFPSTIPILVRTEGVLKARKEGHFSGLIRDYRGVEVYSVASTLSIPQKHSWVILTEIDKSEAHKPLEKALKFTALIVIFSFILLWISTFVLAKRVSQPILQLKSFILHLAQGKIPKTVSFPENNVELSEINLALCKLCEALRTYIDFAQNIGKGNFSVDFQPLSKEDVHGWALIQMRNQLIDLREKEKKLQQQKTMALLEGQETERKRIAQELHDGVGQMLTAIRLRIDLFNDNEQLKKEIKLIVDETINEIRRISNNLLPSVLLDFGLEAALAKLCQSTQQVSGIRFHYSFIQEEEFFRDDYAIDICFYRVAQEAINNILKHADAKNVTLKVVKSAQNASLEIYDDGKGFDMKEKSIGNGIQNMEARVKALNGIFMIHSQHQKGTYLKVII